MLKSTLLFGFVVAVLVEGFPSAENANERYVDTFIFSVSWAPRHLSLEIGFEKLRSKAESLCFASLQGDLPALPAPRPLNRASKEPRSIVLAGLYQVVQTRALREMIRNLQVQPPEELRRCNTADSSLTSLSDWADVERRRPYELLHPSCQRRRLQRSSWAL